MEIDNFERIYFINRLLREGMDNESKLRSVTNGKQGNEDLFKQRKREPQDREFYRKRSATRARARGIGQMVDEVGVLSLGCLGLAVSAWVVIIIGFLILR